MGQRDYCLKRYLSDETRFADLINGILGEGEQLISPSDLTEMDSQVGYREPGWAVGDPSGRARYRDLVKKAACGVNFIVIGVEHQEHPNYLMPLRCMGYDVREYERQAAVEKSHLRQWKKMRKRKGNVDTDTELFDAYGSADLTTAEFLSGFRKDTLLHPCITIVLYFGDKWDAADRLHQMLDFSSIPESLRPYVNDYHIWLVDVRRMQDSDTSRFQTDLRQVFDCIRMAHDKERLCRLIQQDDHYQRLEEDAYDMISRYTNAFGNLEMATKYETEEGKVNMCKAMQELLADEREAGFAQGISQGISQGQSMGLISFILMELSKLTMIPEELKDRISSEQDISVLSQWARAAVLAGSIQEFEYRM